MPNELSKLIKPTFYKDVEIPGSLKHVLYGDSVYNKSKVRILINKNNIRTIKYFTIEDLWNSMVNDKYEVIIEDNKEYIYNNYNYNNNDSIYKILSVDHNQDVLYFTSFLYITRHYFDGKIYKLEFENDTKLYITQNHSLVDYDTITKKFNIISPEEAIDIPCINTIDTKLTRWYSLKYSFLGKENKSFSKNDNVIFSMRPNRIINKHLIQYSGYFYDICINNSDDNYNIFIIDDCIVHNTDSLFFKIPAKHSEKLSNDEKWKLVENISGNINKMIKEYIIEDLFPKMNISPEFNFTNFKSELLMSAIMMLDTKKLYAYQLESKEGKFLKNKPVTYKGIPVVRADSAQLSRDMIKDVIENIVFNKEINLTDKLNATIELIDKYHKRFLNDLKNYDFNYIGIPGKWNKKIDSILSMKLYNEIMGQEIFRPSSSCKSIAIMPLDQNLFKQSIDKTKLIGIPYIYDKEILRIKTGNYKIIFDEKSHWDKLYGKVIENIVNLIRTYSPQNIYFKK